MFCGFSRWAFSMNSMNGLLSRLTEVGLDLTFDALDAGPGDEVGTPGRRGAAKIHDSLRPRAKVHPGSHRAAGHAGGFVDRDAVADAFVAHESDEGGQERRPVVVALSFACAHAEGDLLCRTLALGADVHIKPFVAHRRSRVRGLSTFLRTAALVKRK